MDHKKLAHYLPVCLFILWGLVALSLHLARSGPLWLASLIASAVVASSLGVGFLYGAVFSQ